MSAPPRLDLFWVDRQALEHHRGGSNKEESGYRKAQRLLLALRRAGLVPYGWFADNTRWMRKPKSYAGLDAHATRCLHRLSRRGLRAHLSRG